MYYDYTILHGKFQAAVYALIDGIFHFFKHLPESNIAEDFSEIFFAYVMAYDDVFFTADGFGISSGRRVVSLIV